MVTQSLYANQFEVFPLTGLIRWLLVSALSLFMTFLLLFAMERLVFSEPQKIPEGPVFKVPKIVLPELKIETRRDTFIEKPRNVEPLPEMPELNFQLEASTDKVLMPQSPVVSTPETSLMVSSDVPIATVMAQPVYPARALARGLEGYVDIAFDVSDMGTTQNIRILDAQPAKVFNREAIRAVERWKFMPVTKNGKAIPYEGMQHRIFFQLEQ